MNVGDLFPTLGIAERAAIERGVEEFACAVARVAMGIDARAMLVDAGDLVQAAGRRRRRIRRAARVRKARRGWR